MAARRRQYNDYSPNHYNNSSSALEALPLEDDAPIKVPKKQPRKSRRTRYIAENKTDKSERPSVLILLVMVLIAGGAFLSILINSYATVQGMANNELRNELNTLQMRTSELGTLAATSIDMEEVERIARTRLGMGEPQIHQIRHIYVPWQNYVPALPSFNYADAGVDTDTESNYSLAETSGILGSFFSDWTRIHRELTAR